MQNKLKAFQIKVNGKVLDYRLGKELDLNKVSSFFEKKYLVKKLMQGGRHILGILEKNNQILFLKLATSKGISTVTKNEYRWNEEFNRLTSRKLSNFWVPKNIDSGIYNDKLFYLITDKFDGDLLSPRPERMSSLTDFLDQIPLIIRFSELIQGLDIANLSPDENSDHRERFLKKTEAWFKAIPKDVREQYKLNNLLQIVKSGFSTLNRKPRHGDFTPWHLFKLTNNQLGLIDGEHAMANGVEYYDIGYFIQRVFSVLQNPDLAEKILSILIKRNYNIEKLTVILSARAIGGFLDESLKPSPNYEFSNRFKDWVISLN